LVFSSLREFWERKVKPAALYKRKKRRETYDKEESVGLIHIKEGKDLLKKRGRE